MFNQNTLSATSIYCSLLWAEKLNECNPTAPTPLPLRVVLLPFSSSHCSHYLHYHPPHTHHLMFFQHVLWSFKLESVTEDLDTSINYCIKLLGKDSYSSIQPTLRIQNDNYTRHGVKQFRIIDFTKISKRLIYVYKCIQ